MGKKKRKGGGKKKQFRIIPAAGLVGGVYGAYSTVKPYVGTENFAPVLTEALTGYNPNSQQWSATYVMRTYAPILGAVAASYIGRKLNLNRYVPLPKGIQLF